MLDDQDRDRLLEELKQKFELVEERVDELEESASSEGEELADEIIIGDFERNLPFRVHWVFIEDIEESSCSNIDTVVKAQNAFLKYADNPTGYEVKHGDLLVLMCNHSAMSSIDPDDEESNQKFNDACYYIGMCVSTRQAGQQVLTMDNFPQLGGVYAGGGDMQMLVWDTCGGDSCPEDPETIEIDEIVIPDTSGSGDDVSCLTYVSSGSSETTNLNELKSLQIDESSSGSSMSNDNHVIHDATEFTDKGLLVDTQEILVGSKDYNITAEVDDVSIVSQSAVLQQSNYKETTIESAKSEISSDSCGNLEKAEPDPPEDPKEISVLAKQEGASGGTLNISELDITKTPDTVLELGTTNLSATELGTENPFTGKFFMPEITTAEMGTIEPDLTIPTVSYLSLSIETTGDDCKTITFTLTGDTKDLIFASGVLVNTQDSSPLNIVEQITVAGCGVMCGDCPGVVESDVPFSRIKEYRYTSTGQSTCSNNPDNLTINGNCFTFIREVEYSNWVISANNCTGGYSVATLISGSPYSGGGIDVTQSSSSPCGKEISIYQIQQTPFDLSTLPADEYFSGLDKNNPSNFDKLYIFS